jgi:hypothetical protein
MYHDLPRTARLWSFLLAVDQDLAEETRKKACPRGGRLHCANYLRKPRGTPASLPEPQCLRLSFCCDREGCHRRYGFSAQRSISASSLSSSVPCDRGPRHAGSASSPNASALTGGPSPAGRSSGANTSPRHRSGSSHEPVWCRSSRSSLFPIPLCTPSSAVIGLAGAGPFSYGFSHRLRSPGPCESRSRDDRFQPAEDARRSLLSAGI